MTPSKGQDGKAGERGSGGHGEARPRLGRALRRAWVGYQRQLDEEMAAAGFGRRRIPDGRVLRICARADDVTISRIGRELGITRQGASKIVGSLREDGFVTVHPSPSDGRETLVRPTRRAADYLAAHRKAADGVERRLRAGVGAQAVDDLYRVLQELEGEARLPVREYLRSKSHDRMSPDD